MQQMNIHRSLNPQEEAEFRKWARDNYDGGKIESVWHPVVIHEIGLIKLEEYEKQKQLETKTS